MLTIKISVNAGHTATGVGYGAEYKGFRESEINRAIVKALIPKLQKLGHTVHNSTVDKANTNQAYLSQVVKSSNNTTVIKRVRKIFHRGDVTIRF